ncbi:MAG: Na/Pi symporter [Meiothermus sp.]|nr:Na/Pi symporter [Meiothermus sp.]
MLTALGGLALVMLGLGLLSRALSALLGGPARRLLTWATATAGRSWLAGVMGGAITLNSSAIGLTAIGLADSGIAGFASGLVVGLAAKAGATLALQLAATPLSVYALPLVGVGFVLSLPRQTKPWGETVMGLGLLLLGVSLMVQALLPATQTELFRVLRQSLEASPLGLWILGFALAAFLGSANAVAALALALAASNALSIAAALALTLGGGAGSGLIFVFTHWNGSPLARRIAWSHLGWKTLWSVLALLLMPIGAPIALGIARSLGGTEASAVAHGHTFYHLTASLFILPLLGPLQRWLQRLIPDTGGAVSPKYLSRAALESEALATSLALREICRIGDQLKEMLGDAAKNLAEGRDDTEEISRREDKVDQLAREIVLYLSELSQRHAGESPLMLMMAASEIEHMGDQVRRVLRKQTKVFAQNLEFSREGRAELAQATLEVKRRLELALAALATSNEELASDVLHGREALEHHLTDLRRAHLRRLESGRTESKATTLAHLDMLIVLDEIDQGLTRLAVLAQDLDLRSRGSVRTMGQN